MKQILNNREGLTLLEVIISVALFSGVLFVISSFFTSTTQFQDLTNQKLQVQQDLQQTFQTIVTQIRSMNFSGSGAYPISSASSSSLIFYSDVDEDGVTERVRYTVGTSTISLGIVKPAGNPYTYATSTEIVTTAVEKVVTSTTPFLVYYGATYTGSEAPLTEPIDVSKIRVIQVTVSADLSPKAPKPIVFKDLINIRNLRSN